MSHTQETIQQSIGHRGILTEISMPMSDRELAGNQRGASPVAIVNELQQIEALGLS